MKTSSLSLPSIKGHMGDWDYYIATVPLGAIADRVRYADEVHSNTRLSELIQRRLSGERATEIATYLSTRADRFFPALVVAFYGGHPRWFQGSIIARNSDFDVEDIREYGPCLGVLHLTGTEKLFALDGQHRLAGIKRAKEWKKLDLQDMAPVIFVSHANTARGLKRSRTLFTTLNKEAHPVGISDIIALDENDPAAIVCRRLLDENKMFSGDRVAYKSTESLSPRTDNSSLTSIVNLYWIVVNLAAIIYFKRTRPAVRAMNRPSEKDLGVITSLTSNLFKHLGKAHPAFGRALFGRGDISQIIANERSRLGGNVLYRPIGLSIFSGLVFRLMVNEKMSMSQAVKLTGRLPTELSKEPYRGVLWDPIRRSMITKGKQLVTELLALLLKKPGLLGQSRTKAGVLAEYRELTGRRLRV